MCHTRDISERGCFLDTAKMVPPGTRLLIALLDDLRGAAMEIAGEVARCPETRNRG